MSEMYNYFPVRLAPQTTTKCQPMAMQHEITCWLTHYTHSLPLVMFVLVDRGWSHKRRYAKWNFSNFTKALTLVSPQSNFTSHHIFTSKTDTTKQLLLDVKATLSSKFAKYQLWLPIFVITNIKYSSEPLNYCDFYWWHFAAAYGSKLMGEHSFLMNTLSRKDQRTALGTSRLLSLACEMIMWSQRNPEAAVFRSKMCIFTIRVNVTLTCETDLFVLIIYLLYIKIMFCYTRLKFMVT